MQNNHPDKTLINALGGPSKLASTLGMNRYGAQRVHNWTKRGIPAAVKISRPDLFMRISQVSQGWNANIGNGSAEINT